MIDDKKCYLFGRNSQLSDFCIDHNSCSRVHAALVYHKHLERAFLVDLGSSMLTKQLITIASNTPSERLFQLTGLSLEMSESNPTNRLSFQSIPHSILEPPLESTSYESALRLDRDLSWKSSKNPLVQVKTSNQIQMKIDCIDLSIVKIIYSLSVSVEFAYTDPFTGIAVKCNVRVSWDKEVHKIMIFSFLFFFEQC